MLSILETVMTAVVYITVIVLFTGVACALAVMFYKMVFCGKKWDDL